MAAIRRLFCGCTSTENPSNSTLPGLIKRAWLVVKEFFGSFRPLYADNWGHFCTRRLYSVAAVLFVLWFLLLHVWSYFDPFRISATVDTTVATVLEKVFAPFYSSKAQRMITVVLVTDQTLRNEEIGWPPQYTYYPQLIRRIMTYQPKAVFLDIILEDLRSYDKTLDRAKADLAEELQDHGIPLLVALTRPEAASAFADVRGVRTTKIGWIGAGEYRLLAEDEGQRAAGGSECAPGAWRETAALMLYQEGCADNPECRFSPAAMGSERLCAPMHVRWGQFVSPQMQALSRRGTHDCSAGASSWQEMVAYPLRWVSAEFFGGVYPEALENLRVKCPYTDTVFAHELSDDSVAELLRDRIVLVGTSFAISNDRVESPVHGSIPGVYFHAMALDNLITYGNDFYTQEFPDYILYGLAAVISLVTSLIFVSRVKYSFIHFTVFMILVLLFMCIAGYMFFHIAMYQCVAMYSTFFAVYGVYFYLSGKILR